MNGIEEVGVAHGAQHLVLMMIVRGFKANQKLVESIVRSMKMKFWFVEFGGFPCKTNRETYNYGCGVGCCFIALNLDIRWWFCRIFLPLQVKQAFRSVSSSATQRERFREALRDEARWGDFIVGIEYIYLNNKLMQCKQELLQTKTLGM
jgi:hypothetical protein